MLGANQQSRPKAQRVKTKSAAAPPDVNWALVMRLGAGRILPWVMFLAAPAWAATQKSPKQSEPVHPNVVLITLDTTRADRMGFLGSDRGLTPNLDAMARQGIVFTRAYSHVSL